MTGPTDSTGPIVPPVGDVKPLTIDPPPPTPMWPGHPSLSAPPPSSPPPIQAPGPSKASVPAKEAVAAESDAAGDYYTLAEGLAMAHDNQTKAVYSLLQYVERGGVVTRDHLAALLTAAHGLDGVIDRITKHAQAPMTDRIPDTIHTPGTAGRQTW